MFEESSLLEKLDAPATRVRYGQVNEQSKSKKRMTKSPPPSAQVTDWSAMILRVRDERDETAFSELFNHFAPRIKGFLVKSGTTTTLAEECAQEAMVTLWNKAHLFDPTRASAATWIFTIARNKKIDAFRRAARPEPEDLPWGPEPEPEASDVIVLQQETQKLSQALEALPEKQKEIVRRAYFGELSHAELAQETGLPLGTIKSRIRLALDRLRQTLSE